MFLAITIILIVLSLVCHEAGHWYEMHKRGVSVVEAGLGFPLPYISKFLQIRFTWSRFPGTTFTLNPLLLGAYVKPSREGERLMEAMPYRECAPIYGAGPLANLWFAWVALLAYVGMTGGGNFMRILVISVVMSLITIFRRAFVMYLVPVLGTLACVLLGFMLNKSGLTPPATPNDSGLGGPVTIVRFASQIAKDFPSAVYFAGMMSANIALLNMIPFFGFDGGRIADALLRRWPRFQAVFRSIGMMLLVLLLVTVLAVDCKGLLS